ncbi:cysteine--tRNA ligase [Chelativorans sp. ZYF759]|uniref:cysteine--tRNA ligase n=1 Tax=Chelativorans sp. ZYF759 TaxID=2692213 RepID=UPI00145DD507|nr:cysteine--tRNA ligase [Chelativorans sp. ZYF759]NMG41517.1 cysteine--tRNA ligase [Chelativorans sp. ZYF759]
MGEGSKGLRLYNTLTRTKEDFVPLDAKNVRMYVCGPTVYDFAHIGNARPVIVFDVLYRLLRHLYGEDHVTYVRNITDVDDKINDRALRDFGSEIAAGTMSLNEAIGRVTQTTADQFHADVAALGCLEPTFEPRATQHIDGMIAMAQTLLDKGHAYVASGNEGREVLFDVSTMPDYGKLSNRKLEDQQAGARVEVASHKKNPGDFVLWKESSKDQPGWPAHFHFEGKAHDIFGRPGWHIECSVMSRHHLGEVFDIHGGGLDLIFPHHENEIAQSCCAHGTDAMARYWLHNGYLQVEGRKMSKSEGNFVTIDDLLHTEKFGGRKWPGEVLRLAMLMTHYRQPIDFKQSTLVEAQALLAKFRKTLAKFSDLSAIPPFSVIQSLLDDLNTPGVVSVLSHLDARASGVVDDPSASEWTEAQVLEHQREYAGLLWASLDLLGLAPKVDVEGDKLTENLRFQIGGSIEDRLSFLRDKNFAEADRIRDELAAQGIQLMDYKDPETGERKTKWEVKR